MLTLSFLFNHKQVEGKKRAWRPRRKTRNMVLYLIHLAEQDHKQEDVSNARIAIATISVLLRGFTIHVLPST